MLVFIGGSNHSGFLRCEMDFVHTQHVDQTTQFCQPVSTKSGKRHSATRKPLGGILEDRSSFFLVRCALPTPELNACVRTHGLPVKNNVDFISSPLPRLEVAAFFRHARALVPLVQTQARERPFHLLILRLLHFPQAALDVCPKIACKKKLLTRHHWPAFHDWPNKK